MKHKMTPEQIDNSMKLASHYLKAFRWEAAP